MEVERGLGVSCSAAGGEGAGEEALSVRADGEAAMILGAGGASEGISKLSGGDSMIWAVELKYRARFGRRNVGISVDAGIRMSRTDFRSDLVNILVMRAVVRQLTVITLFESRSIDVGLKSPKKYLGASILRRTSARRNLGASKLKL